MLKDLEEKIKNYLSKLEGKDRSVSLLDIAKVVDPRCRVSFNDISYILLKLEKEGFLYHYIDDTYSLFPYEKGFIQGTVRKNDKGEVFINDDNNLYIIDSEDSRQILDGDKIIAKKTDNKLGRRIVCTLDKIVKRKDGIITCEVVKSGGYCRLLPLDDNFKDIVRLDRNSLLEFYDDKEKILVKIGECKDKNGIYIGRIYDKEKEKNKESFETLKKENIDIEYENYTLTGSVMFTHYNEGLLVINGKKYLIRQNDLYDVLPNDLITIIPSKEEKHGVIVSKIDTILKRNNKGLVGEVTTSKDGKKVIKAVNYKFKHNIYLDKDDLEALVDGDRLLITIDENLVDGCYRCTSFKHIGHKDDPDSDLKLIAAEYDIEINFTDEELKEADSLPKTVTEKDKENRLDLTKKKVFTIDGVNTKDRDDAISIERLDNGHFLVGVHISDVTHYIKPGDVLWNTLLNRVTSVYMANTVIAMLPHIISNGICSLNPGVDRLTFSFMAEMDEYGNIYIYDFVDTVINSNIAMTYDDVNDILENKGIKDEYRPFVDDLKILNKIAISLQKEREKNGALNFDKVPNDIEIEFDSDNNPIAFNSKEVNFAEKLIENFMLLAGKCYAEYMFLPTTLRVHERPDEENIKDVVSILNKIGVRINGIKNVGDAKIIYKVIQSIEDEDLKKTALGIFLRSLKKARIDVDPEIGHFALSESKQGRFTSPIRRAEDALGHIQLRKQRDNLYDLNNLEEEYEKDYKYLERISKYITQKQINAENAENDAIILKMMDYTNLHIGEDFKCVVTYINEYGIYIKTENGILGVIRPIDYEDEPILYNDKNMSFYTAGGTVIKIGSIINATALSTSKEYKTINFGVRKQKRHIIK